uniref:R-spondin 2 n=1 Tax=Eptatretus burgeri TaxID=7764 RepID=A0A8C4QIQ1_EPTBU
MRSTRKRLVALLRLKCEFQTSAAPRAESGLPHVNAGGVPCPRGCMHCSEINGCLACKPRLFFHLLRRGMRQTGTCRHDCPPGYYGQRGVDVNRCRRCQLQGCERCFSNSFCTHCLPGFLLHRGKCNDVCPRGFDPHNATSECILRANCVVGSWGSWSSCSRLGSTCGYKWGFETRRRLVQHPESQSDRPCPALRESRRCRMLKRDCQKELLMEELVHRMDQVVTKRHQQQS